MTRCALVAGIVAVLVAGCGSSEPALPGACIDQPGIVAALARAPDRVMLADGTSLSRCVRLAAARDGDLQSLGLALTAAAEYLRASAATDGDAALALGWLVGAVRRGARQTPGVAAQLARRVEQAATVANAGARAALRRGIALGEAGG